MQTCILFLLAAAPLLAQQSVKYELSFPNAVHHEAEVQATFTDVTTPTLDIVMSRSSPGRYALHEFAKNLYSIRVHDGAGKELQATPIKPSAWRVAGHNGTIVFRYTLFGDRTDGTYDGIDETHAHLNMPATLVWAHGYEKAPVTLRFSLPEGRKWQVATQLEPQKDGNWFAPNLDRLMDGSAELSNHYLPEWKVENANFRVALHFEGSAKEAKEYARQCEAVALEEEAVFGALPKYDYGAYTFLVDYLPYASFDGMEHRDSTVITGTGELAGRGSGAIGAAAHEFFHSWNVKRMRPKSLEPFDYEEANSSGELWFAEGFTNYYGPLALERAGLSNLDQFIRNMSGAVNAVLNSPGRKIRSAVEMSRFAPFVDAATSIDPRNFSNTYISYYTYGQALAFGIDLAMRERFSGKSLDDWMRTMWREHPDVEHPYTLTDLETALTETTGDAEFARELFERHISGKEPLDYQALVKPAGLILRKAHSGRAWWGRSQLNFSDSGAEISNESTPDSPLYAAGLERGDRIVAFDNKPVRAEMTPESLLSEHKPGDRVRLRVQTRGGEREAEVRLEEDPQLELATFENGGQALTPAVEAFRKAWLGSKALHPLPKRASLE